MSRNLFSFKASVTLDQHAATSSKSATVLPSASTTRPAPSSKSGLASPSAMTAHAVSPTKSVLPKVPDTRIPVLPPPSVAGCAWVVEWSVSDRATKVDPAVASRLRGLGSTCAFASASDAMHRIVYDMAALNDLTKPKPNKTIDSDTIGDDDTRGMVVDSARPNTENGEPQTSLEQRVIAQSDDSCVQAAPLEQRFACEASLEQDSDDVSVQPNETPEDSSVAKTQDTRHAQTDGVLPEVEGPALKLKHPNHVWNQLRGLPVGATVVFARWVRPCDAWNVPLATGHVRCMPLVGMNGIPARTHIAPTTRTNSTRLAWILFHAALLLSLLSVLFLWMTIRLLLRRRYRNTVHRLPSIDLSSGVGTSISS